MRARLGPLESELLEWLWERGRAATVRDACAAFPQHAYTTLLTTFDRLHRKKILARDRHGRAFAYAPRFSRTQWLGERASREFGDLLASGAAGAAILSHFVSAVGRQDARMLDELDSLVQAERRRLRGDREEEA
ncbi:MAG: BlaI/MecI/CopY family transcriptional regulator [Gammaproteobacteria bacterium]|nr:BlaI/MecI/CopY family transcriptional regulator [Gammaproteobacteria bacterium]